MGLTVNELLLLVDIEPLAEADGELLRVTELESEGDTLTEIEVVPVGDIDEEELGDLVWLMLPLVLPLVDTLALLDGEALMECVVLID